MAIYVNSTVSIIYTLSLVHVYFYVLITVTMVVDRESPLLDSEFYNKFILLSVLPE